jgi:hypothetical protein
MRMMQMGPVYRQLAKAFEIKPKDVRRWRLFGHVPRVHALGAMLGLERRGFEMDIRLAGAQSLDEIPGAL